MIDIDAFISSLQIIWVKRLMFAKGKWADIFQMYIERMKMGSGYIWKTSFRSREQFPQISLLPKFYENIVIGFNKVKCIKPFHLLSSSEIVQLPLWGSEYFKVCNTCLYLKPFIDKGIYYVKDIVDNYGNIIVDTDIIRIASGQCNQIQQSYLFKNCVINKIKSKDLSISPFVKIKS